MLNPHEVVVQRSGKSASGATYPGEVLRLYAGRYEGAVLTGGPPVPPVPPVPARDCIGRIASARYDEDEQAVVGIPQLIFSVPEGVSWLPAVIARMADGAVSEIVEVTCIGVAPAAAEAR